MYALHFGVRAANCLRRAKSSLAGLSVRNFAMLWKCVNAHQACCLSCLVQSCLFLTQSLYQICVNISLRVGQRPGEAEAGCRCTGTLHLHFLGLADRQRVRHAAEAMLRSTPALLQCYTLDTLDTSSSAIVARPRALHSSSWHGVRDRLCPCRLEALCLWQCALACQSGIKHVKAGEKSHNMGTPGEAM